jgi:hypothetical protein
MTFEKVLRVVCKTKAFFYKKFSPYFYEVLTDEALISLTKNGSVYPQP